MSLGHISSKQIILNDEQTLLENISSITCETIITTIDYFFGIDLNSKKLLISKLLIRGISSKIHNFDLKISWSLNNTETSSNSTHNLTQSIVLHNDGVWESEFELNDKLLPYGTIIRLESDFDTSVISCPEQSKVNLQLQLFDHQSESIASDGGFEKSRNQFVGGFADRFSYRNTFIPHNFSFFTFTKKDSAYALVKYGSFQLSSALNNFYQLAYINGKSFFVKNPTLINSEDSKTTNTDLTPWSEIKSSLIDSFKKTNSQNNIQSIKSKQKNFHLTSSASFQTPNRRYPPLISLIAKLYYYFKNLFSSQTVVQQSSDSQIWYNEGNRHAALPIWIQDPNDLSDQRIAEELTNFFDLGWIGIMFKDRIRYRPSGLVVGEIIGNLSLPPGGEDTISKRSETKRSVEFEKVVDQEFERKLEFSSTWSTDFSQDSTNSHSNSTGGNLGANIGINLEYISFGIGGGASFSSADSFSRSRQIQTSQEIVQNSALTARTQHKITLKQSSDITDEFSTKQIIRNPNPSRAVDYNFYKLYQKYRVLLERYDAKLCLSFCIPNPGNLSIDELKTEISQIDPNNPRNYVCQTVPDAKIIEEIEFFEIPGSIVGGTGPITNFVTPNDTNLVLDAPVEVEVVDWWIKKIDEDGVYHTYKAGPIDRNIFTHIDKPAVGSTGGLEAAAHLNPEMIWGVLENGHVWGVWKINLKFTWKFAPSSSILEETRLCREREKQRLRDELTIEKLSGIVDRVKLNSIEFVKQKIIDNYLLPNNSQPMGASNSSITYPPGGESYTHSNGSSNNCTNANTLRNLFDWNEISIEYLPWWLTNLGRLNYENLKSLLSEFPKDLILQILQEKSITGSIARVLLPIKPGSEFDAIAHIANLQTTEAETQLKEIIDTFTEYRNTEFGSIQSESITTFEQILSNTPPLATPSGKHYWNSDWEKPTRKFHVLSEWAEYLPTDSIHTEMTLSTGGSEDIYRKHALESDLKTEEANRELIWSEAEAKKTDLDDFS